MWQILPFPANICVYRPEDALCVIVLQAEKHCVALLIMYCDDGERIWPSQCSSVNWTIVFLSNGLSAQMTSCLTNTQCGTVARSRGHKHTGLSSALDGARRLFGSRETITETYGEHGVLLRTSVYPQQKCSTLCSQNPPPNYRRHHL